MKKIAYWSSIEKEKKPEKDVPVGLTDQDSATENAGRAGWSLLERTTEPLLMGENEPEIYEDPGVPEKTEDLAMSDKVRKILVELGDGLDESGEYELANFADFLIKKFAEAERINFSELYNQLMLKINNSDLTDRNETMKKLTKIYSKTLLLEHTGHQDKRKAEESAYKKTLHRADQYLGQG